MTVLKNVTMRVRTPRALFADFPFGYPLGRPNEAGLQTRILRAAFALLSHPGPPPVLVDFD